MHNFIQKMFKYSTSGHKTPATLSWVKSLKDLDDVSAIEFATQQFKYDMDRGLFNNALQHPALIAANEVTEVIIERVNRHFLDIPNISMELEERMSQSAFLYHRQLFLIYLHVIESDTNQTNPDLTLMLGRAIHCATHMIHWRYYNYHSAPANVWLQLSALFQIAEKRDMQHTSIVLYKNMEPFTLTNLFIFAMMMGSIESLSLKRQQIELVHLMLIKWAKKISIKSHYDEKKHLFFVDTSLNMPAKRIRNLKAKNTCLYWGFDAVNGKIDMGLSALELNILPKQLRMETFVSNPFFISTLEALKTEWSHTDYKRQRRSEPRIKTAKSATTSYGFEDTCYQIKQYQNLMVQSGTKAYQGTKTLDERLALHSIVKSRTDHNVVYLDLGAGLSNIVDESTKGLGLNVTKNPNEVSLGMLVAVTDQAQVNHTSIGLIRCIRPILGNELHIGVEIISKQPYCVEVKNVSLAAVKARNKANQAESTTLSVNIGKFTALFLPQDNLVASQETVIVPRLQYNQDDAFTMVISGTEVKFKLGTILQRHEDWLRVAYQLKD